MDAADVLYGVSMGGDGVTKVVSRRLPREVAEDGGEAEARASDGAAAVRRHRRGRGARSGEDTAPRGCSASSQRVARGRSKPPSAPLKGNRTFPIVDHATLSAGKERRRVAQRHMDRLTSFDTSFLANEKSNGHMAIGAVLVCEGEPPSHEDFLAHIRSRVHLLPRLRQRLAYPPLGLGHARSGSTTPSSTSTSTCAASTLPAPGTEAQFRDAGRRASAPPLDRSRAALGADRWSRASRTTASRSSTRPTTRWPTASPRSTSAMLLFDVEPNTEPVARGGALGARSSRPRGRALVGTRGRPASARPLRRAGPLAAARRRAARAAPRKRAADGIAGLWEVTWNLSKPAPKVPLNVEIGPDRSFYWAPLRPRPSSKQIKNALGGTVNDVSLAVAAGALRRWMLDRERARPTGSS